MLTFYIFIIKYINESPPLAAQYLTEQVIRMRLRKPEYTIADRYVSTRNGNLLSRSYKLTGTWESAGMMATAVLFSIGAFFVVIMTALAPEPYKNTFGIIGLVLLAIASAPHAPWRAMATKIMGRRITLWGPKANPGQITRITLED